jgi:hypothetical protein
LIGTNFFSREIDIWPVKLHFFIHTGFIVFDFFAALLLCVIHYFAVNAEFTIFGCVKSLA